jgi:hypothetical protein
MAVPPRRKTGFVIVTVMVFSVLFLVMGELLIRVVKPLPVLYPRFQYSPLYGQFLWPSCEMVNERPGSWRFVYTVNEFQYRGTPIGISNTYAVPNIVLLGDSYTFGEGVADTGTFGAVMADKLQGKFNVVNLGVPGWGLTQEIRRYYEFGRLYDPSAVILQFCKNDPEDDLESYVTTVQDGKFVFQPLPANEGLGIKKYLSKSLIQKSQLYNLIAAFGFRTREQNVNQRKQELAATTHTSVPTEEKFYNELLDLFARDLAKHHVRLLVIAVDKQLEDFPYIKSKVQELDGDGVLRYHEVAEWFTNVRDYGSPEGHAWGSKAHRILGTNLAEIVRSDIH